MNFWATLCAPCRSDLPELNDFARQTSVNVVCISLDVGDTDIVRCFVADYDMDYMVLIGGDQRLF